MSQTRRLEVCIDDQTLTVFEDEVAIRTFSVSTAEKGMGFAENSYRTPTGRLRISEKIGDGAEPGTIFKSREVAGLWNAGDVDCGDLVLTRILRLEGLDAENENTLQRFIYIHGTNHEDKIGSPSSEGCIRLKNQEMIELFDMVDAGVEVSVNPATRGTAKLFFIDCDSTLSTIEGIDELARAKGDDIFQRVVDLTHMAMNGEIPISDVFFRRMDMIRPDKELCDEIAARYIETMVPGVRGFIDRLKAAGWTPVVLSGGFAPLIKPLAKKLGISHVEAVPLYLNEDGSYRGYGEDYPTTRNLGKNEVIREWKAAMLPTAVVMMGDGMSDLETKPDVDLFVGFGGVVPRPRVKDGCDEWILEMNETDRLFEVLSQINDGNQMI